MRIFLPEGRLLGSAQNTYYLQSESGLEQAKRDDITLEAHAKMCNSRHDLIVELPFGKGIIPRCEGAVGIEEGTTRDIALLSALRWTT